MHEMAIAQGIINIAVKAAKEENASKVTAVKAAIGQMTGIDQHSLIFCFAALAKAQEDIDAAGAILTVEIIPLRAKCQNCRSDIEFKRKAYRFFCPYCASPKIDIVSGRELKVIHIDVE